MPTSVKSDDFLWGTSCRFREEGFLSDKKAEIRYVDFN
jgi:hypothetical protein